MAKRVLSKVSTDDLAAELNRRSKSLRSLERKRDRLSQQLADIEAEIIALGGESGAAIHGVGPRKRPRNDMNLEEALIKLLKNKTLSVTDTAEQVQKSGYKTTSPNFRTIVNQTLINSAAFKRVSRGKYTVKANYK